MHHREWALVAFTLLMQASVGIVLTLVALQGVLARGAHGSRPFDLPLTVAGITGLLALAASLLHLGHPVQAWLAVSNLRTSWLSREVLLAALFVAATVTWAALNPARPNGTGVRTASWAAVGLGLAAVSAMSRLYMVPAQPVWNNVTTPAAFFATTLLVGIVVVLALGGAQTPTVVGTTWLRLLVLAAMLLVAVQLVLVPAYLAALPREPAPALASVSMGHAADWLAAARVLTGLGAVAILLALFRTAAGGFLTTGGAVALVLLVVSSEIMGRVLFYAASVHLGPN